MPEAVGYQYIVCQQQPMTGDRSVHWVLRVG